MVRGGRRGAVLRQGRETALSPALARLELLEHLLGVHLLEELGLFGRPLTERFRAVVDHATERGKPVRDYTGKLEYDAMVSYLHDVSAGKTTALDHGDGRPAREPPFCQDALGARTHASS